MNANNQLELWETEERQQLPPSLAETITNASYASARAGGPFHPEPNGDFVSLKELIDLYQSNREAFFVLSNAGADATPSEQEPTLAQLAEQICMVIRNGFQVVGNPDDDQGEIVSGSEHLKFCDVSVQEVANFLHELNGTYKGERGGKDYEGHEVSEAEVLFALGDKKTWNEDQERRKTQFSNR